MMTRFLCALTAACGLAAVAASTAIAASAAATAGTVQDQGRESPAYRATEIIGRWRVIILSTFEERRASAEEPIVDSIEIVISPAAVRVVQDRVTEQQLKSADGLIQRFALAMVAAGERLPDGSVGISEQTIDTGLAKVCPAYPLCPK
jgi:hypothetical protein